MSTMDIQLTQRNGSLPDLVTLLREQHAAKLDVVEPGLQPHDGGAVGVEWATGPSPTVPNVCSNVTRPTMSFILSWTAG